jgi:hypothetical protein
MSIMSMLSRGTCSLIPGAGGTCPLIPGAGGNWMSCVSGCGELSEVSDCSSSLICFRFSTLNDRRSDLSFLCPGCESLDHDEKGADLSVIEGAD